MAAEEVIHFLFWAQLSPRPNSPTLPPPEPVAESPPELKTWRMFTRCGRISDRYAIRVSNRHSECSSSVLGELSNSKDGPIAKERGSATMKADGYTEIFLWNQNIDRLVRVLQRLESFSIRPKRELKAYEIQLEEIRAGLNADFTQAMAVCERADETRLRLQRTAWERKNASGEMPS
jgi:hypothetical protein